MANYTAADVKALREKSGAGMMDCKSALDEADGNIEKAFEVLRLKGLKGVSKREGRATSNGLIVARVSGGTGYLIELACETDFVAKAERFVALGEEIADAIVAAGAKDLAELKIVKTEHLGDKSSLSKASQALGKIAPEEKAQFGKIGRAHV